MNISADKKKALDAALAQVKKQFGNNAVMILGDRPDVKVEHIPTGVLTLDRALGIGGLPRGRIIEIYGPESSGKTTLALKAVAQAQKAGGLAAFIDVEHALDPKYAEIIGVDTKSLVLSQPTTAEEALEISETLVRSGVFDIIVLDSVAALVPKAELEGDMGDAHVALQARLMSQALRKLTGAINQSKTIMVFINQVREKVGVMFGNPETTPGGRALKFYASVRIEIRRITSIEKNGQYVGNKVRAKIVKNKVAPPFKTAEFEIMFNEGISVTGMVIDLAVEYGLLEKSGAWYSLNGTKIGQGKENAKKYLKENKDVFVDLYNQVSMVLDGKSVEEIKGLPKKQENKE